MAYQGVSRNKLDHDVFLGSDLEISYLKSDSVRETTKISDLEISHLKTGVLTEQSARPL